MSEELGANLNEAKGLNLPQTKIPMGNSKFENFAEAGNDFRTFSENLKN